jgi:hypothetical protein
MKKCILRLKMALPRYKNVNMCHPNFFVRDLWTFRSNPGAEDVNLLKTVNDNTAQKCNFLPK